MAYDALNFDGACVVMTSLGRYFPDKKEDFTSNKVLIYERFPFRIEIATVSIKLLLFRTSTAII